jgi:ABC-type Fe3+ transport system substrate-binding protein
LTTTRKLTVGTKRRRRRMIGIAAAMSLAIIVSGCSSSGGDNAGSGASQSGTGSVDPAWAKVLADANQEGAVTVYVSSTTFVQPLTDAWKAAFPSIKLTMYRETTTTLTPKLDQERAAGAQGADVTIHNSVSWFDAAAANGGLTQLPAYAPDLAPWTAIPEYYHKSYVEIQTGAQTINTNTSLSPLITDPMKLLDPALKGKIGVTKLLGSAFYEQLNLWNTKYPGFMEKLGAQKVKIYPDVTSQAQDLAAGEITVAFPSTAGAIAGLAAQGAPVKAALPSDGTAVASTQSAAVVSWASHKNAALVFMNWLLAPTQQKLIADITIIGASPLPSVKSPVDIKSLHIVRDPDWPASRKTPFNALYLQTLGGAGV